MGFVVGGSFVWGVLYTPPQQHAANDQRSANGAAQEEHKNNEQAQSLWVPTDSVGLYTLVLAAFTFLLVVVSTAQGFFLLRSDKTARIAANAAALSAKAAIAIELPVIAALPESFSWAVGQKPNDNHTCHVQHIAFYNHGRTDAYLSEIKCGWIAGHGLPAVPNYQFVRQIEVDKILKQNTGADVGIVKFEFAVAPTFFDQLRTGEARLWFFCCLVYTDFLQQTHEAGFCWERWQRPGAGGFKIETAKAYNRKT
jgi:hypothetical protein